ncbi:unnamed protein product [Adineta ricciae]|uniref:Cytochrome b5 domain-containing protein 1 n=1 Tax=Adineta ricciae TaxID=249248 RepID=A0A815Q358_ADIRI|nr:unnamed protein product [Adineta ricciae]
MQAQMLSLDIEDEIDRIDAIFTVPTGPIGRQEVNYHVIDEQRIQSIAHSSKEVLPANSSEAPLQELDSIKITDPQSLNNSSDKKSALVSDNYFYETQLLLAVNPVTHREISEANGEKAQFSLPEIDNTKQSGKKYPMKKTYTTFRNIPKTKFHEVTPTSENERTSSHLSTYELTVTIPQHCRPDESNMLQQRAETLVPFYTLNDLAQHNDQTDAWICILDHIYDVTSLVEKVQGTKLYQQLISYAGQDISVWFDEITHEPRKRIDPHTYEPVSVIDNVALLQTFATPFWQTKEYFIGQLSTYPRYIRLIHNFMSDHSYILEVAEEDTIGQIARKFLKYNSHIFSYIWRYNGQILDYNKTLTENGISNEESFHDRYGWRSDNENCPTIILCFSDDLTVA